MENGRAIVHRVYEEVFLREIHLGDLLANRTASLDRGMCVKASGLSTCKLSSRHVS